MEYEVRKRPGFTEFRLKGSMVYSDHGLFKDLISAFDSDERDGIIFQLADLKTIDSSGLGMLIIARDEAIKRGLSFTLESPQHEVKRVMDMAKFDRFFDVKP